jgi:uncharacterized protein YfaS (alpha-2-macroglobulin family)
MSLIALTDYLSSSGELQGGYAWQVGLNGRPRQSGSVSDVASRVASTPVVVPVPELQVGENKLELIRSVGSGRLYYTLQLKSYSPAEDMPFVSQGFSVAREYLPPGAGANAAPLSQVHAGDLVQVRLTVIAPNDLHDVVIEDPLPAGLEPLDAHLKTTSTAATALLKPEPGLQRSWRTWSHVDVRSDRVALFATYLTRGAYQYTYLARANLAGEYRVLPANGREQYFPEVFARSDGRRFTVLP